MEITQKQLLYAILIVVLLGSLYFNLKVALTTPIIFGDEGFYASRGQYFIENLKLPEYRRIDSFSEAYREFFFRPPLYMILMGFSFLGGEVMAKALNPILGFLLCISVFYITKRIFSLKAAVFTVVFLVMMPAFITHEIILFAEVLGVLFASCSVYFFYDGIKNQKTTSFLVAGILAGLAILTEIGSLALIPLFIGIVLIYRKNKLRKTLLTFAFMLLIIFPWYGVHNYMGYGNRGLPLLGKVFDLPRGEFIREIPEELATHAQLSKTILKVQEYLRVTTETTVLNFGVMKFIEFAYNMIPFLFASIGGFYLLLRRKNRDKIILLWLLIFLIMPISISYDFRAEDISRALLYIIVPMSILAGIGLEKISSSLESYKKIGVAIAIILIVSVTGYSLYYTSMKAESLRPIREWSPAFFKGCEWIKENTPEDALLVTLWKHRAEYACRRDGVYHNDYGGKAMIYSGNDTSYDIMKLHGADYIYIQKFSIKPGTAVKSTYPWIFIKYILGSDHFKKVYEYPQNCMSTQEQDCVVVYEVL